MNKRYDRDFDEQFEAFLKDSVSSEESLDSARISKYLEKPKRESKPWWMDDDDAGSGGAGSGKSFLKKKTEGTSGDSKNDKKSTRPEIQPRTRGKKEGKVRGKAEISISKDSLDDISEKSEEDIHHDGPRVHIPAPGLDSSNDTNDSPQRLGMDTLDEMADKEKFFRDLEKNADGTIDYGRLNQELSVTANTLSPEGAARTAATLAALEDIDDEDEEDYNVSERPGAPLPGERQDVLFSEKDQSEQKPSMLSKVSLMDSLESTMNTTTSPQVGKGTLKEAQEMFDERDENEYNQDGPQRSMPETLKTATGFMGTNTSQEIEALHRALREVGLSATLGNDSQLMDLSAQGEKGTADLVQKLLIGETGRASKSGKQRTVEEILKELEDLQKKARDEESRSPDVKLPSESQRSPKGLERQPQLDEDEEGEDQRGFALSPVHRNDPDPSGQGFDNSHTEDTELYQPVTQVMKDSLSDYGTSVTERSRGKKKFDKPQKSEKTGKIKDKTEKDSKVRRSRSSSPLKTAEKSMKLKYNKVKSSGYGQSSPPKPPRGDRDKDKERDLSGTRQRVQQRTLRDTHKSPSRSPARPVELRKTSTPKNGQDTTGKAKQTWSPADTAVHKVKGTQSGRQAMKGAPVADTQIQASIESFTQYIKEHFMKRAAPEIQRSQDEPAVSTSFKEKERTDDKVEMSEHREKLLEAKDQQSQLQADLDAMTRGYERKLEAQKLDFQQQIAELKQENYVLSVKVSEKDSSAVKRKVLDGGEVSKDDVSQLQKEIKEQETLIAGYQQENKRLYNELKNLQKHNKQMEERMFQENQKLLAENANLKTQLEKREEDMKNKGAITSLAVQQDIAAGNTGTKAAGVVAHLESELAESKRTCDAVNREMLILQQQRVELEKHIDKVIKEREELRKKLEDAKTMKSEEAQELEAKYQEEIEKLKKKIKWYAENQELLEKGTKKVKARDDEIHKLRLRIEDLQTESGKRVEDSKVRARERAADAKKIQDLQRQVKEMEQILKRRHPNALPTLMMAAAAAETDQSQSSKSPYIEVLEKRIKKLEAELESKDGDTETMLRGVEQKYNTVKLQFEDRIKDLELQLSIYQGQTDHVHPHTHAVALERELESVRERYKKQVVDLQQEVDKLNTELGKSKKSQEASVKAELQSAKESEVELRTLVKSLQVEVESKNHDLQVLQKSLERLRKEKHLYMVNGITEQGKKKSKAKSKKDEDAAEMDPEFHSLPVQPSANDKEYEPKVFEGTHISDIIKENEELRMKVDQLQLRLDHQRVDLQKSLAETEAIVRRTREDYEEKIDTMRSVHQKEVQKILAQQALDHSTSKMAELQSKLDTQEVMIRHLREQQARLEVEAEAASVLRIKQTRLEEHLKTLHNDLKEAKKSHTPEMRHFETLQEKIVQIENKHTLREQELQQIICNAKLTASVEMDKEVQKWKKIVEVKNDEIQKFRMELDSILEVLRMLQRQGVVIPVGSSVT